MNSLNDQLFNAVKDNDLKKVHTLLNGKKKVNINWQNPNECGSNSLMIACTKGNMEIIEILLSKGATIHLCDSRGYTALHKACQHGYFPLVELLIIRGANVLSKSFNNELPIHEACEGGNLDVVAYLYKRSSASIEMFEKYGWRPLHFACAYGYLHIVKFLIEKYAIINATTNDGRTPLHIACEIINTNRHSNNEDRAKLIDDKLEVINYLIDHGANINEKSFDGRTPLHYACTDEGYDIMKLLLTRNADIEAKTPNGSTVLHYAVERNYLDIIELLTVQFESNILSTNKNGWTCIKSANRLEVKEFLIDINKKRKATTETEDEQYNNEADETMPRIDRSNKRIKINDD